MRLRLIGILLVSIIGLAQGPAPGPSDLWHRIRSALMAQDGEKFFQQIRDCQIPTEHKRFSSSVVAQPSPNELVVNVEDPAGDAILRFPIAVKRSVPVGSLVHFEGVVRTYSRNPYSLTIEVLPEDIDGL